VYFLVTYQSVLNLDRIQERGKAKSKLDYHVMWTYIDYCTYEFSDPFTINYKITNNGKKMHANNIHTYMAFYFINPCRPIGLGYETCLPELTDIDNHNKTNTYN
jgi:hypothetical protein